MKEKNNIFSSAGLAAAITWFGTHCGSGFATGRQLITYLNRHGIKGLWMAAAIWSILALLFYIVFTYAYESRSKNYKEFVNNFYSPYGKTIGWIWDFVIVFTTLIALGGFIATGGTMLMELFGGSYGIWLTVYAIISFLLTAYGKNLILKIGTLTTVPLIVLLLIIIFLGIMYKFDNLTNVLGGFGADISTTTWVDMIYDVYNYAGVQNAFIAGAIGIGFAFTNKRDIKIAAFGGAFINCVMTYLTCLLLFTYYPDINQEVLPVLEIVKRHPLSTVLMFIYPIAVLLAVTSSVAPLTYGVINRFAGSGSNWIKSEKVRISLYSAIVIGIAAIVSTFGLANVIDKGYKISASLRFPLLGIPIMILGLSKIKKLNSKQYTSEK